jgi:hypothetical protein
MAFCSRLAFELFTGVTLLNRTRVHQTSIKPSARHCTTQISTTNEVALNVFLHGAVEVDVVTRQAHFLTAQDVGIHVKNFSTSADGGSIFPRKSVNLTTARRRTPPPPTKNNHLRDNGPGKLISFKT